MQLIFTFPFFYEHLLASFKFATRSSCLLYSQIQSIFANSWPFEVVLCNSGQPLFANWEFEAFETVSSSGSAISFTSVSLFSIDSRQELSLQ